MGSQGKFCLFFISLFGIHSVLAEMPRFVETPNMNHLGQGNFPARSTAEPINPNLARLLALVGEPERVKTAYQKWILNLSALAHYSQSATRTRNKVDLAQYFFEQGSEIFERGELEKVVLNPQGGGTEDEKRQALQDLIIGEMKRFPIWPVPDPAFDPNLETKLLTLVKDPYDVFWRLYSWKSDRIFSSYWKQRPADRRALSALQFSKHCELSDLERLRDIYLVGANQASEEIKKTLNEIISRYERAFP